MTTLADVIAHLFELDDDHVIYAAPRWRVSSPATAAAEPRDGGVPRQAEGMTYLVDVASAKRVIAARNRWRPDRALSIAEKCNAVIYYAIYDEAEPLPSAFNTELDLPEAV